MGFAFVVGCFAVISLGVVCVLRGFHVWPAFAGFACVVTLVWFVF